MLPNRFVFPFGIFAVVWAVMFLIVIVIFFVILIRNLRIWHKNNKSPRLTVEALAISKRTNLTYHGGAGMGDVTGAHGHSVFGGTTYYTTFEFESGDRLELPVSGEQYGLIAEGDKGRLTFQGTRFISFERTYRDRSSESTF